MIATFVAGSNVLVCAPAGCGKTHLLVESVAMLEGRQLILTHTNAGVKELRRRLERKGISAARYNLRTIDSFAQMYVGAYPQSAGVEVSQPTGAEWVEVKEGFLRLLEFAFIKEIIAASYAGIMVDEYQDCSVLQHEIVVALSNILPIRIVGDPMQNIFDFGSGRSEAVAWATVEQNFRLLGTLHEPYRWREHNVNLGKWIQDARSRLENGQPLSNSSAVTFHLNSNRQTLLTRLHQLADQFPLDSIGVIFPSRRASCWALAGQLRNRYEVLEDADCVTLLNACPNLDRFLAEKNGEALLNQIISMIKKYAGKLPAQLEAWRIRINSGSRPRTTNSRLVPIIESMILVHDLPCLDSLISLHRQIEAFPGLVFKSREMWITLNRAMLFAEKNHGTTLEQAVRILRHRDRLVGRRPPHRCVSTTLLLKGMEFDHVVIADYSEYAGMPRHFYVAISRAKKSLEIFRMVEGI